MLDQSYSDSFYKKNILVDRTSRSKNKIKYRERNISDIRALVLHSTGFSRGNVESAYDNMKVHFGILPNGTIIQLYDEVAYLPSSNGANSYSVAVEFVGNFPDSRGNWHKGNKGRQMPSAVQIISGRALIVWLRSTIGIRYIYAHRQLTPPRRRGNCPGPHIWYNVGVWALSKGYSSGSLDFTIGGGGAIPNEWLDPGLDLVGSAVCSKGKLIEYPQSEEQPLTSVGWPKLDRLK